MKIFGITIGSKPTEKTVAVVKDEYALTDLIVKDNKAHGLEGKWRVLDVGGKLKVQNVSTGEVKRIDWREADEFIVE